MRPIVFLISTALAFIALAIAYVVVIDRYVLLSPTAPVRYSQFLLEAASELQGKVVIESGSNSVHGLDASRLSDYFEAPVIIAADVQGYPLRKKVFRLERALNKGDVVILPLEWHYYYRPAESSRKFVEGVADKERHLAHYVVDLPVAERVRFILQEYPLRNAFESITIPRAEVSDMNWAIKRLDKFKATLLARDNLSAGGTIRDGPEEAQFVKSRKYNCDKSLLYRRGGAQLSLSDNFLANLDLLQKLHNRGVSVYLTWPVVVDAPADKCYSTPGLREKLDVFAEEIVEAVESRGMKMLGEYSGTHFTQECFLNTNYHIRWSCAPQRTQYLIDQLEANGVGRVEGGLQPRAFERFVLERLGSRQKEITQAIERLQQTRVQR